MFYTKNTQNYYTLSLTEKIFYWHIANSNPKFKNYLLSNIHNIYVESRKYTHCGMYIHTSSLFNKGVIIPEYLYATYVNINNNCNIDFIIYTDKENITTMELVAVEFEFDEMQIASLLVDDVLQLV